MNPTVYCTNHARPFAITETEEDHDGVQLLVKQYWKADCGCAVEVTLAIPTKSIAN
jgi:hypothetical protein